MMTVDEMNAIREELHLTYQEICFESGVPISTVQKILGGITKNPRVGTMQQLGNALQRLRYESEKRGNKTGSEGNPGAINSETKAPGRKIPGGKQAGSVRPDSDAGYRSLCDSSYEYGGVPKKRSLEMFRDAGMVYGTGRGAEAVHRAPALYTAADRDALPAERRTELVDGVIYDMASPKVIHQKVSLGIYNQLLDCIRAHGADCQLFAAPTDVYLNRDEYTVVVPDVFIVCDPDLVTREAVQGAPDFILEVISPSTMKMDYFTKLEKYFEAGVREYWIADPHREKVTVYVLAESGEGCKNSYDCGGKDENSDKRGENAMNPDKTRENDKSPSQCGENATDFSEGKEDDKAEEKREGEMRPFYDTATYTFDDKIPIRISEGTCSVDMNLIREEIARLR